MTDLVFYSNPGCHLCEQAALMLQNLPRQYRLKTIDIEGELALVYHYGTRIPVLKRGDTGAELDWPFDDSAVAQFLS